MNLRLANSFNVYMYGGAFVVAIVVAVIALIRQYKRCPKNKIMVIYGLTGSSPPIIIQGGGAFVKPVFQAHEYISLEPMTLELDMNQVVRDLDAKATQPAVFTIAVCTKPDVVINAVERLIGLPERDICSKVEDIAYGQLRMQLADKTAAYINSNRLELMNDISACANKELAKIGIKVTNIVIPRMIPGE
jgi:flotillin